MRFEKFKNGKVCVLFIVFTFLFLFSSSLFPVCFVDDNNKPIPDKCSCSVDDVISGMCKRYIVGFDTYEDLNKHKGIFEKFAGELLYEFKLLPGLVGYVPVWGVNEAKYKSERLDYVDKFKEYAKENGIEVYDDLSGIREEFKGKGGLLKTALQVERKEEKVEHPFNSFFDLDKQQVIPWGVHYIDAPDVWSSTNGSGIKVGIIDTGIDFKHPDLDVKVGMNFAEDEYLKWNEDLEIVENSDNIKEVKIYGIKYGTEGRIQEYKAVIVKRRFDYSRYEDIYMHGTHVAGIVAAKDNNFGVVGVAPGVELYSLRVFGLYRKHVLYPPVPDYAIFTFNSWILRAIEWAVENKIHIVNLSLGISWPLSRDSFIARMYQAAYDKGLLIIAASGNDNLLSVHPIMASPAIFPSVVAVGSINAHLQLSRFSDVPSAEVRKDDFIVAPGEAILSTFPTWWRQTFSGGKNGLYFPESGTSMAAPHATGLAALIWSANPSKTNKEIREILTDRTKSIKLHMYETEGSSFELYLINAVKSLAITPEPPSLSLFQYYASLSNDYRLVEFIGTFLYVSNLIRTRPLLIKDIPYDDIRTPFAIEIVDYAGMFLAVYPYLFWDASLLRQEWYRKIQPIIPSPYESELIQASKRISEGVFRHVAYLLSENRSVCQGLIELLKGTEKAEEKEEIEIYLKACNRAEALKGNLPTWKTVLITSMSIIIGKFTEWNTPGLSIRPKVEIIKGIILDVYNTVFPVLEIQPY